MIFLMQSNVISRPSPWKTRMMPGTVMSNYHERTFAKTRMFPLFIPIKQRVYHHPFDCPQSSQDTFSVIFLASTHCLSFQKKCFVPSFIHSFIHSKLLRTHKIIPLQSFHLLQCIALLLSGYLL